MTTITVSKVKLIPLATVPFGELAESLVRTCSFCSKEVNTSCLERINRRLGGKNFYCSFCLRNNFHTRNNKHLLILSFRSVLGYYYYEHYIKIRRMWFSEIDDYIEMHQEVGMKNPVFSYDPATLLWFVDFSKVGTSRKKIGLEEIFKTIFDVLNVLDMPKQIPGLQLDCFLQKYKGAIQKFYSQRYRPESNRMLIPTLVDCVDVPFDLEKTRNFTRKTMIIQ